MRVFFIAFPTSSPFCRAQKHSLLSSCPTDMNAAIAQFFDIPELADTLGSHLAKSDVATLVRTCRQFKNLFEPWLYRDLALCSSLENRHRLFARNGGLFRSTHSVRPLSRNTHHVRRLTCCCMRSFISSTVFFATKPKSAPATQTITAATAATAAISRIALPLPSTNQHRQRHLL
ncbi:MAG: hypothetical protein J3R72DRAFT_152708 [Linnemannia gamsii]|nr:MAG: hypothetical protein J3R72DRAFT_152708 [Linnemannia gamsii]